MYALVDCNNFYANCERLFQPWLDRTPIVVLSNNDGCVIARSQEAKALGIKMGEPAFKKSKVFVDNNVQVFSSNYTLYGDLSRRVMSLLSAFSPKVEIYSIDEAFLSLHNMDFDIKEYGYKIKEHIYNSVGLPVCVGIGKTKTLAKVANHIAKKDPKNKGVFQICNIKETLSQVNVDKIWGIGKRYSYLLNKNNVYSALQFINTPDSWIKKNMTICGLRTKYELLGQPCIPLESEYVPKKAIATTRSFASMTDNLDILKQAVSSFASKCAFKLRSQNSSCMEVLVFVATNRHRKELKQDFNSINLKFTTATNSTIHIVKKALLGLQMIYKKGFLYKKAGVIVSKLTKDNFIQNSLFDTYNINKHNSLMHSIDYSNYKTKIEKITIASSGTNKSLKTKRENLSKCYTTRWDELIEIN